VPAKLSTASARTNEVRRLFHNLAPGFFTNILDPGKKRFRAKRNTFQCSKRQRKAFGTAALQVFDSAETGSSRATAQRTLQSLPKNSVLPKNLVTLDHLTAFALAAQK
jgi:hypothetical protein